MRFQRIWQCLLAITSVALTCAPLALLASSGDSKPFEACPAGAGWSDMAAPRHIHGNTWYVGSCGITALLITSADGHVLIDGATEQVGGEIVENIRALGFKPEGVRYLLSSHEHSDHVGGLAEVQRLTGAPLLARAAAARTLKRGESDRSDPQFLVLEPFPAVPDVQVIDDDARIEVGDLVLKTIPTPGHTLGSTSWTWRSCADDDCLDIVYADSLTAMSDDEYSYSDDAAHPGVVQRFRQTLARIAGLSCDILLTPHPSASKLWSRIGPNPVETLVDADACRAYAQVAGARLDARVAEEADAARSR